MFGSYRVVLALCVVAHHYFGVAPLGNFAVFGFFCLSGFLMTLLMNGPYAGRPFVFAANRFLRIFPSYWLVAAVSAAYILLKPLPELIGGTTLIGVPTEWSEIIKQTILVIGGSDRPMIVPVAWSLTNELVFYALIAAGISKTPMRAILWLMASALIAALEMHTRDFYYDIRAASLPFALGAVAFHFTRSDLFAVLARWKSGAALAANGRADLRSRIARAAYRRRRDAHALRSDGGKLSGDRVAVRDTSGRRMETDRRVSRRAQLSPLPCPFARAAAGPIDRVGTASVSSAGGSAPRCGALRPDRALRR